MPEMPTLTVTTPGCANEPVPTGNDLPLFHEIRHALERLLADGNETVIDLRGIPMAPGEEERIEAFLDAGEVQARIEALGPSEIRETAFPGVWLVTHYNSNDEVMGKFVEVTRIPAILESQSEDMRAGLQRLSERLSELG